MVLKTAQKISIRWAGFEPTTKVLTLLRPHGP